MSSIADLTSRVKGDVITPEHPEYVKSLHRWACNAERKAAVVVFVKNEADVAAALSYAKEHQLPIAIRGGGHSAAAASSVEGGLVIDLSRHLNGARVDPENKRVYVGGGALWEAVDKAAIEHGLATVAGTVNHTGVGGLTLGGGFGWLSGEHGLAVDNLVQVTLVSANGSVHKASETENPDLFFGVRGGGCNFGVVTEFVFALHPQRKTVFGGPIIFPGNALQKIVEVAGEWYPNIGPKEGMIAVLSFDREKRVPVVICMIFYNGSEAEGKAKYKKFYDIGPIADMAKERPFEELNSLQNHILVHGNGIYWKGLPHDGPNWELLEKVQKKSIAVAQQGKFLADIVLEWMPLQKIREVPADKMAVRRPARPNCLIHMSWPGNTDTPEMTDEARVMAHEIALLIAGGKSELKDGNNFGYTNYDPEGIAGTKDEVKDRAEVAFGENHSALRMIKKLYDPDNIFNRWFPIVPA